jgi:chromosome segregation ATPase
VELRAQLGQAEVKKLELQQINERLEAVNDELRNDVEVAENDRTVLKDSLVEVETERTKMNLDLGEVSQQKLALEAVAAQAQEEADRLRGELGEARDGRTEAEMEAAALQGELSSLREELAATEEAAAALRGEVGSATQAHAGLLAQYGEAEAVAEQQRAVVASLEELQVLEAAARRKLEEEAVQREEAAARLEAQLAAAGEELTLAGERQQELEEAAETGRQEAREATIRREEVEESLLDTQGLVEAMEDRLQEADTCNRQEVDEVAGRARRAEAARDRVAGERAALLEMNTALSAQVDLARSFHPPVSR